VSEILTAIEQCPLCEGRGGWLRAEALEDQEEWELERAFRTLEIQRYAEPWQVAHVCISCGLPFLYHKDVHPTVGPFCAHACQLAYYARNSKPLPWLIGVAVPEGGSP
jgi:hypothetical protein